MQSDEIGELCEEDPALTSPNVSCEHSSVNIGEVVPEREMVAKHKSSSLSCLHDTHRIRSPDNSFSTLPTNLSTVKPFTEELGKGLSMSTYYDTNESLGSSRESSSEDISVEKRGDKMSTQNSVQRPTRDRENVDNEIVHHGDHTNPDDLSEMNTATRMYVRSSALDILAAFPQSETVSSVEKQSRQPSIREAVVDQSEPCELEEEEGGDLAESTGCEIKSENLGSMSVGTQKQPTEARKVISGHGGEGGEHKPGVTVGKHPAIHSWSSTGDFEKEKKKRLFHKKKKKMVYEVTSASIDQVAENGQRAGDQDAKTDSCTSISSEQTHKMKKVKQRNSSTSWLNFFIGKPESKDEKPTKTRKPVQKSKSFNSVKTSTSKNNQLSRMNSIRKIFRKPIEDAKPTENKCVVISPPIVKSEFRADNLVDREVIIARNRGLQTDKDGLTKPKNEREAGRSETPGCIEPGNQSKDILDNGCAEQREGLPVPPVRKKHLERKEKQRLSTIAGDENHNSKDENYTDLCPADEQSVDPEPRQDSHGPNGHETDRVETKTNDGVVRNSTEVLGDNVDSCPSPSTHESWKPVVVGDESETDAIIRPVPEPCNNDSGIAHDLSPVGKDKGGNPPTSPSPSEIHDQGRLGEEVDDVFEDCLDDKEVSLNSTIVAEEIEEMKTARPLSVPRERWKSDVSSDNSKKAITSLEKAHSFPGGSPATSPSTSDPPEASCRINGERPPQRRAMSIFGRVPSMRFEPAELRTLLTDMVPTSFPAISADRRSQIVLELFTTERTYVRGLETIIELFQKPLLSGDEKDVDTLFSNINDIFSVNKDLLFLLWEKLKHWDNDQCIGHIFVDMEDRFKMYAIYCKNFDKADTVFKQKMKKNKDFEHFFKSCYQDPLCQPGLDLPAYLITVVQRIPRYLLLLKDLCKKTPASHPDYDNLKLALTRMNKVAEYINSQLQEVHGKKAMQELRSTVIGLKAYEVKGRTLLKEAEVCLMSPKKPYKCLLFNDIMVFAVQGPRERSEIEMTLELKTLWFEDLKKSDPQTNKCDAIELFTPHRPYTMYACSRADKRVWIQKLRTAIVNLLYGPDCEDPDAMDISRRKASDTYIDGSVYCGEYLHGKRHGQGVMASPNRTRYEGSWADDERHGQGQLTYYTGEKYIGSWVADKKDGEGEQTFANGDKYTGQWSEGKMHGKGVIDFANGDRFVGDMVNNEVEGNGEIVCVTSMLYKGEWKKSKRHGQGHLFFPNGNEYIGEMLNDRICGFGRMIYANGDEYTGEWVNEMRHGIGCFKLVKGTVYDGQWNNDFMNGQGKMTYPNGDVYSGTWHQNKRVGKGQLNFAHGDTYNGQWEDDSMNGKGVMYFRDGSVYDGTWERGQRHGYGTTVYCDKSSYEGEYKNGFRHGRGKLIYSNNVCYVGEWKCDKFDGNGVFSDPNTEYSYQGDWICGMREGNGVEISYKARYEGSWKADMRHGQGMEKSHAGHTFEGTWKENKKHGQGLRILRSKVREEQLWHEGHLVDLSETVADDLPILPRR